MRHLRLLILLGTATLICCVAAIGIAHSQALATPDSQMPEGVKNPPAQFAVAWTPGTQHPGQEWFDKVCATCHLLGTAVKTGPGLRGVFERIETVPHQGKPVQQRMLEYIKDVKGIQDPYFQEMQKTQGPTPGVDMTDRGGLPSEVTDAQIIAIIDYILRHYAVDFDETAYLKKVRLGQELVSGARSFKNGAPACIGCHTAGAEDALRGANIGGNIAHTYVAAKKIVDSDPRISGDENDAYIEGLFVILSGDNAPRMHRYYRDGYGHLEDGELTAVMTFFDHQMRQVGTERESNYLPIFALVLAALFILLMEPGLYANLFAKHEQEYIDGPYEAEHHEEAALAHEHGAAEAHGSAPASKSGDPVKPETGAQEAKAGEGKGDMPLPHRKNPEEAAGDETAPDNDAGKQD